MRRQQVKIESIDIEAAVEKAKAMINLEQNLSPAFKSTIEILLLIVILLSNRLNLNSNNSSKPPSSDPNRKKKKRTTGDNKPGGQKGHEGKTLQPLKTPDLVEPLLLDESKLPPGGISGSRLRGPAGNRF
jgi:transposase